MLQTKAIYNLLQMQAREEGSSSEPAWAIEDLRTLQLPELFSRLGSHKISLNQDSFIEFAKTCETPEEFTELVLSDEMEEEARDPIYLLIFELFRRLCPEKQSLSIFFDEIDHLISLYDQALLENDEALQQALANLLEVLEDNQELEPAEVFRAISEYSAHDLFDFIQDYISELLDNGDSLYASELIERFTPYAEDPHWFDFFRVRLLSLTDVGDAHAASSRILEGELSLPLLLEMLRFFSQQADRELFALALKKALPLTQDPDDLEELQRIAAEHFRHEVLPKTLLEKLQTHSLTTAELAELCNLH